MTIITMTCLAALALAVGYTGWFIMDAIEEKVYSKQFKG